MEEKSKKSQLATANLWLFKLCNKETLQEFDVVAVGNITSSKRHVQRVVDSSWEIVSQMPVTRHDAVFAVVPYSWYANFKVNAV